MQPLPVKPVCKYCGRELERTVNFEGGLLCQACARVVFVGLSPHTFEGTVNDPKRGRMAVVMYQDRGKAEG